MMRHEWLEIVLLCATTSLLLCVSSTCGAERAKRFCDMAKAQSRPVGAPKRSDVCLSSRWKRPKNEKDPHDTFKAAEAFHATRLDWVYSSDVKWIAQCRKRGYHFGGALNSKMPDSPGAESRLRGRIHNAKGELVTAPWMKGWKAWWGCVNSPEFCETFLAHAKRIIDGGGDVLHMDDPDMNFAAVKWGGCYCAHCKKKAKRLGKTVRQIQRTSVKQFFQHVRKEINEYAGRRVPFSCNNYGGNWTRFPYSLFDYGIAELPARGARPDELRATFAESAKRGKAQVFTFVSKDVALTRRVIATAYACGGHIIVPWDVFLEVTRTGSVRLFSKPMEYADLYGFVRANARWLDGYEDACDGDGKTGPPKDRPAGNAPPIAVVGGSGEVRALVRAVPGDRNAPVVIHLVEWGKTAKPCMLKLPTTQLFGGGALAAELMVPAKYDKAVHKKAEKDKEFSALTKSVKVKIAVEGEFSIINLPPLSPWGTLVVSKVE